MLRRSFLGLLALLPWVRNAKAFDRFSPRANEYRGLMFRGDQKLEDGATYFECTFDTGTFSGEKVTIRKCHLIDTVWTVNCASFIDCFAESRHPVSSLDLLVDAGEFRFDGMTLYLPS